MRINKILGSDVSYEQRVSMGEQLLKKIGISVPPGYVDTKNTVLRKAVWESINHNGLVIESSDYESGKKIFINAMFWLLCYDTEYYAEDFRVGTLPEIYKNYYLTVSQNNGWYNVFSFIVSDPILAIHDFWILDDMPLDFKNAVSAGVKKRLYEKKYSMFFVDRATMDKFSYLKNFKVVFV